MVSTAIVSTDEEVRRRVLDELRYDPEVKASQIGVTVDHGIVTLTGTVPSYRTRAAALTAALRVHGVKGVANEIVVEPPLTYVISDEEIAKRVNHSLKWRTNISNEQVKVSVSNGWVRLEGTVDWQYQKETAEQLVTGLEGVRGVTNLITVKPVKVPAAEIKEKIEQALIRSAMVDAMRITVAVEGATVTLSGKVRSWLERQEAERAAWSMPGVLIVHNHIVVEP
jgi:osmotically-inducible protein OsmY